MHSRRHCYRKEAIRRSFLSATANRSDRPARWSSDQASSSSHVSSSGPSTLENGEGSDGAPEFLSDGILEELLTAFPSTSVGIEDLLDPEDLPVDLPEARRARPSNLTPVKLRLQLSRRAGVNWRWDLPEGDFAHPTEDPENVELLLDLFTIHLIQTLDREFWDACDRHDHSLKTELKLKISSERLCTQILELTNTVDVELSLAEAKDLSVNSKRATMPERLWNTSIYQQLSFAHRPRVDIDWGSDDDEDEDEAQLAKIGRATVETALSLFQSIPGDVESEDEQSPSGDSSGVGEYDVTAMGIQSLFQDCWTK